MRALLLVVVALAGCRAGDAPRTVLCYPTEANGWTFECEVTGRGGEKAHERFAWARHDIAEIERQGNDPTRTFKGQRWVTKVKVERAGSGTGVESGERYTFYGTVVEVAGDRVRFTDCVFTTNPPVTPK